MRVFSSCVNVSVFGCFWSKSDPFFDCSPGPGHRGMVLDMPLRSQRSRWSNSSFDGSAALSKLNLAENKPETHTGSWTWQTAWYLWFFIVIQWICPLETFACTVACFPLTGKPVPINKKIIKEKLLKTLSNR